MPSECQLSTDNTSRQIVKGECNVNPVRSCGLPDIHFQCFIKLMSQMFRINKELFENKHGFGHNCFSTPYCMIVCLYAEWSHIISSGL